MYSRFGNILIGWCPGDVADLIETMAEEELSSAITEHLRMFFGIESFSCKFNYYLWVISVEMNKKIILWTSKGKSDIPQPKSVISTKWRSNRFIKGTYTYHPVGVDGQIMDTLAQPLMGSHRPGEVSDITIGLN